MAINKTTIETKNKIKANSVIALPNRPQIPAEQLKQAFVKPIVDTSNSMIQELDRIVEETNAELEQVQVDITNAIDEHNTNTEATHLDIRQEITDLENDLQEQIDGLDATLQNHVSRIGELELFAENLETNITEEIEGALDNKADLVDGKVPLEQLPDVEDVLTGDITSHNHATEIGNHNTSETAHSDIRQAITNIQTIIATIDGETDADSVINKLHEIVALLNGYAEGTTLADLLSGKVDKIDGKGLTKNELTDVLLEAYNAAYTHSQSDHAPTNAQANVIEGVQVNGVDLSVANKKVNVTVPTIPDISLNDNQATAGKYISKIEVDATDEHKLVITKADLPTVPTKTSDLENNSGFITSGDLPTLATVATSGSYTDLSDKPTIPTIPNISIIGGAAESGKYISQVAVDATDKHKLNITKENLPTLRPTVELEVASLTTLTEAEKLAIKNTLSSLIVDDKIDGTKFDDIVLVTTNDLIRLHYSSIDYYVANPQITVIFETQSAKYILNVPVEEYGYSTLTSTSTYTKTEIDAMFDNLLGGSY